ncbi:KAT8 regulatory NSL complex subunit 1 [Nymphon striatum]|nr:KAT8 regulatory NSL complex subunit 1 [Nymphon striatum]
MFTCVRVLIDPGSNLPNLWGHSKITHRRAAWKWAVDRGAVASKWTWLQAQISDLEYRIRKQTDVYQRLRSSKSTVNLKETFSPRHIKEEYTNKQVNSIDTLGILEDVMTNFNNVHNISRLTESMSSTSHGHENFESVSYKNLKTIDVNIVNDPTCVASRVRPLIEGLKRRKLIRTSAIYPLSPKIPKSNHFRCGCLPYSQCIMCGGRNSFSPIYDSESLPLSVANVDPGYHSVLSFKQDFSLAVRFEKLLKGGEWQKVNSKSQPMLKNVQPLLQTSTSKRAIASAVYLFGMHLIRKVQRSKARYKAKQCCIQCKKAGVKCKQTVYEYVTDIEIQYTNAKKLSDKKRSRTSLPPKNGTSLRNNRAAAQISLAALKRQQYKLVKNHFATSSANSSKAGSPVPSPLPCDINLQGSTMKLQNALLGSNNLTDAARKRRDSAYDIDNIVIPYSMTASTRIEKLQYKEIITPKWRLLQEYNTKTEPVVTKEETPNICKNNGIIIPAEEKKPIFDAQDNICVEEVDSNINEDEESACERGFSAINGLKTQYRTSLNQNSLSHLMRVKVDGPSVKDFNPTDSLVTWINSGKSTKHLKGHKLSGKRNPRPGPAVLADTSSSDGSVEDISDDAFIIRHGICETLEKKRFLGITNQSPGRSRTRVSRIDSRADSSGCNTPDPLSPPSVDVVNDHPSPISSPTTLIQSDDFVPVSAATFSGNCSASIRFQDKKRILTPSGKDLGFMRAWNESAISASELSNDSLLPVVPYDSRNYPLTDEEYNELLTISSQQIEKPVIVPPEMLPKSVRSMALAPSNELDTSRPVTPEFPSSTSESLIDEPEPEDPNDPEWTVISNERAVQRQSSSLVLKLTKR